MVVQQVRHCSIYTGSSVPDHWRPETDPDPGPTLFLGDFQDAEIRRVFAPPRSPRGCAAGTTLRYTHREQCFGLSLTFWYRSRSGSGAYSFRQWISRCTPKKDSFFYQVLLLFTYQRYIYTSLQRQKVTKLKKSRFFCLLMDGSGSVQQITHPTDPPCSPRGCAAGTTLWYTHKDQCFPDPWGFHSDPALFFRNFQDAPEHTVVPVLQIRILIRISRIRMFLDLLYPDPDHFIIKQK